jgi:ElaB/YqjD/DUF883 family membrane-anchored ribosome-binding protein
MSPSKQLNPRNEFENMPGGPGEADRKTSPSEIGARAGEKVGEKVEELTSAVSQKAASIAEKAKDTARDAANKAGDLAKNVGHKAEDAVSSVGGQMKSLAGTIREKAPHEGVVGSTASAVANTLDSSGSYLQQHNFQAMAEDMTDLIRRYPIQSLLVGIGVGFLIAKATRS